MSSTPICILNGTVGYVFYYSQWLPLLISAAITGISTITRNLFFAFLGTYLFLGQLSLWPFQNYFNSLRPTVMCQTGQSAYSFPSIEMYFVASITTVVIKYAILYRGRPGWLSWIMLFFLFAIPATVLVFFQLNLWWEVLFSAAVGIVETVMFMWWLFIFISPIVPYLESALPFGYNDDHGWLVYHNVARYQKHRKRVHKANGWKGGKLLVDIEEDEGNKQV